MRGVSVSLSWLFVTAECVGAAVETEREREDEGALITERNKLCSRDSALMSAR